MTKLVRLDKPIPASVDVTVTYELPDIEPKAGQLWEHVETGQRFRLVTERNDFIFVTPDWEQVKMRGHWFLKSVTNGTGWLNKYCKLIEDAQ